MLFNLPKNIFLGLIRIYQKTLSLDHGPLRNLKPAGTCKYYPTCSQYAHRSISMYGLLKGSYKAIKRLVHCNPWSKGGYDPVK